MTIVAHISDLHLGPLPRPTASQLIGKRITGYVNWRLKRHNQLSSDGLEKLMQHLRARNPEFIALTGDLVNLALPAEVAYARTWLDWMAPPERMCISPGNHDAYVGSALADALQAYGDYMTGETLDSAPFPFVRRVNETAIVSCSSAIATPPFVAAGYFDRAQANRLARVLELLEKAGYFRIVMMHHPPNRDAEVTPANRLYGASRFRKVIAAKGAELVLHGHTHRSTIHAMDGPQRPVPVIGVASASAQPGAKSEPGRYNLFQIERATTGWSCTLREYGYERMGDEIVQRLQMRIH